MDLSAEENISCRTCRYLHPLTASLAIIPEELKDAVGAVDGMWVCLGLANLRDRTAFLMPSDEGKCELHTPSTDPNFVYELRHEDEDVLHSLGTFEFLSDLYDELQSVPADQFLSGTRVLEPNSRPCDGDREHLHIVRIETGALDWDRDKRETLITDLTLEYRDDGDDALTRWIVD